MFFEKMENKSNFPEERKRILDPVVKNALGEIRESTGA